MERQTFADTGTAAGEPKDWAGTGSAGSFAEDFVADLNEKEIALNEELTRLAPMLSFDDVNAIQWCALNDEDLDKQVEDVRRSVARFQEAQLVSHETLAAEISL